MENNTNSVQEWIDNNNFTNGAEVARQKLEDLFLDHDDRMKNCPVYAAGYHMAKAQMKLARELETISKII